MPNSKEHMKKMSDLAKGKGASKRTDVGKARISFNRVKTYPVPEGVKLDPKAYRGDLMMNWIKSKSGRELVEITELENMVQLLKGDEQRKVWQKLVKNQPLTQSDQFILKMIKEIMEGLHKLKYGEKRVNVNTDFKDIREMMWGEKNVNPPSN